MKAKKVLSLFEQHDTEDIIKNSKNRTEAAFVLIGAVDALVSDLAPATRYTPDMIVKRIKELMGVYKEKFPFA